MAKTIEEEYKLLTQEEQILLRPDTVIGAVTEQEKTVWAVQDINDLSKIEIRKQTLKYIPGFLKIFDEILTNASDHVQRGGGVKVIRVEVSPEWQISVWNDGTGIPVVKHKEHGLWLPGMLLGMLNSGSNYNDTDERYGAGRNGLGSGATALFSSKFVIDCADGTNRYQQEILNNCKVRKDAKIKPCQKSYTQVSYIPDFERLPIIGLEEATLKMILKRVIDIAVFNPKVKVYFNDQLIQINSIKDWCMLHLEPETELYSEVIDDKWSIALAGSNTDQFEQCSIVNGNTTWIGGTHIDYIMSNVVKRLTEDLTKGNKGIKIRPSDIRSKFHLFLVSRIANPTFDTQTKENLTIKITDKPDFSDKIYKQLLKSEIIENILNWVQMKEQMELNKMNKKAAGKTLRIPKLVDAHKAGTDDGWKAALVLAEGDSAVGTFLAGISELDRNYYGAFPLRGKPLNVRDAKISKITENKEIFNIMQIIGLVPGKKYQSLAELRYGKIIFMTDGDLDGISIKGLLINLIHKMWPELLELGFCYEFITPIVIARKGKEKKEYYNLSNYYEDKASGLLSTWTTKYYKGLGTIQAHEIKEMCRNIDKHLIKFNYDEKRDSDSIDLLFNKTRADNRKEWLLTYKGEIVPDKFGKPNQIKDFIDLEFIQFSNSDNIRSIPNIMDGLKPSQRKIMFSAFKRGRLKEEIKVAQFGASTAEVSAYHNGEDSLMKAIVGMAQDFVGANNINLLLPNGNYGSRYNPDSAASPRYIMTQMNPITNLIYRKEDEFILNWLDDDGMSIEPETYYPIIPMVLVNGALGIGTGWSTNIPRFSPTAIIQVLKKKIEKPNIKYKLNPWSKGFLGDIVWNEEKGNYTTYGVFEKTKKGVRIIELPLDCWTEDYLQTLDSLCDDKVIKNYISNSSDNKVDIEIHFNEDWTDEQIYTKLKLTSSISISNMHTFIGTTITKWERPESLLNKWFEIRLQKYEERKSAWIDVLKTDLIKLDSLYKFIQLVVDGTIVINNRKKDLILKDIEKNGIQSLNDSYDHLLSIPVYNFTKEKVDELKEKLKTKKIELKDYSSMTAGEIWLQDLEELESELERLKVY